MQLDDCVKIIKRAELESVIKRRQGEVKSAECWRFLNAGLGLDDALAEAYRAGARFALLGIPESISVEANGGRPGATEAWECCLASLANIQDNRFFDGSQLVLVGNIACAQCADLGASAPAEAESISSHASAPAEVESVSSNASAQSVSESTEPNASSSSVATSVCTPLSLEVARALSAENSERVAQVVRAIVAQGLMPLVVGGGHGNAYGLIKGAVEGDKQRCQGKMAVVNCDPHADFRALEGHHSGNGFSYAFFEGFLKSYYAVALHESYNSEAMLQNMDDAGVAYSLYEDIFVRGELTWEQALQKAAERLEICACPVGVELDLDSIAFMPSSAMLPYGISVREAARYLHVMASRLQVSYLHLPEGAPSLAPDGERTVGRALAFLLTVFVKACQKRRRH